MDNWVNFCQIHNYSGREEHIGKDPYMRPSELARFEHAFYPVWTIGIMGSTPHLQDQASAFLDDCSPQELFRLDELSVWSRSYNDNDFGPSRFDLQDNVWKAGRKLVHKLWEGYMQEKTGLPGPEHEFAPMAFYAFFDHTQRYLVLFKDE